MPSAPSTVLPGLTCGISLWRPKRVADEVAAAVARHADGDDEGHPVRPLGQVAQPEEVRQQEAAVEDADGDRADIGQARGRNRRAAGRHSSAPPASSAARRRRRSRRRGRRAHRGDDDAGAEHQADDARRRRGRGTPSRRYSTMPSIAMTTTSVPQPHIGARKISASKRGIATAAVASLARSTGAFPVPAACWSGRSAARAAG